MIAKLLQQRIADYRPGDSLEQESMLQELMQHFVLRSFADAGFFSDALLCRAYVKSRDWYDLLWYVARNVSPDLALLRSALAQQGPWAGQDLEVTPQWYLETLRARIDQIDWRQARADVERFLSASKRDQAHVALWNRELFHDQIDRMVRYLAA